VNPTWLAASAIIRILFPVGFPDFQGGFRLPWRSVRPTLWRDLRQCEAASAGLRPVESPGTGQRRRVFEPETEQVVRDFQYVWLWTVWRVRS
jgi:hypothetical protein